jgi:hypothetical protein
MSSRVLPQRFGSLERFAAWAIPTMDERVARRISTPYEEAKTFYDAVFPQLEDVLAYLGQYPLNAMPDEARRLSQMVLSLVEISIPVEIFHQMTIPNAAPHDRFPINPAVSGEW